MEKLKGSVHEGYIRPTTCNNDACLSCDYCDIEPIHNIESIYMQMEIKPGKLRLLRKNLGK